MGGGGARRGQRLEIERAEQVAIEQFDRGAGLARQGERLAAVADRLAQPVGPVLVAARGADAAAAVVVEHGVVAGEHHLFEKAFERQQLRAEGDEVEDVAVQDELRDRSGAEQVAHVLRPGGQRRRAQDW